MRLSPSWVLALALGGCVAESLNTRASSGGGPMETVTQPGLSSTPTRTDAGAQASEPVAASDGGAAGAAAWAPDAAVAALPASDGGRALSPYDAGDPSTWRLSARLGPGSELRAALVRDLSTDAGPLAVGEARLSPEEANALLDDPRAELVYADRTIGIVAPSMVVKQRKDHLDLLKIFLQPDRLSAGVAFAKQREAVLARAEAKHHVDREVIVSILSWESKLGTNTGDFVAFNAFTSQAFFIDEASAVAMARKDEQKLSDAAQQARRVETIRERARRNLLALVRQCKAKGIDVFTLKGSWAGALGYPQFMPASLRWAEDGDGDGKIDLFTFDDAIFSVGRYLSENGFARSREKAVWSYNHEDAYVKGVLAYADALKVALGRAPADGGVPDAGTR